MHSSTSKVLPALHRLHSLPHAHRQHHTISRIILSLAQERSFHAQSSTARTPAPVQEQQQAQQQRKTIHSQNEKTMEREIDKQRDAFVRWRMGPGQVNNPNALDDMSSFATFLKEEVLKREKQPLSPTQSKQNEAEIEKRREEQKRQLKQDLEAWAKRSSGAMDLKAPSVWSRLFRRKEVVPPEVAKVVNRGTHQVLSLFDVYVESAKDSQFFEQVGIEESSWYSREFFLWVVNLWAVMRRMRFDETYGANFNQNLTEMFWDKIERKLRDDGYNAITVSGYQRKLQNLFYGCVVAFDEALCAGEEDSDALLAEVIWKHFYGMDPNVDLRDLNTWIRYVRFSLSYLDHMDSAMVLNGVFHLYTPHSQFVSSF